MPQCTEQLGHFFDEGCQLPWLHHTPAFEFVDAIKAHQNYQHSTGVIDDADDRLDSSIDLPEFLNPGVLRVGFVELV